MEKPDIKLVLDIVRKKKEAAALYEQIDAAALEIKNIYGGGRYDYDLEQFLDEQEGGEYDEKLMQDGRYLKLEVFDNAQRLMDGETVFKAAAISPVSFSYRSLKRCPDSLK